MKNKEQVNKEFDENFVEMHPIHGHDMNNRPILYETDFSDIDEIKKFISSIRQNDVDELIIAINTWVYEHDNYPTMMSSKGKFAEGLLARKLGASLITHLKSIKEKI